MRAKLKIVLLSFLLLFPSAISFAQGYMIKPMIMELRPHAGEKVTKQLEIRNIIADKELELEITPVLLTQKDNGAWSTLEPNRTNIVGQINHMSCLNWMELNRQRIIVRPLEIAKLSINFDVPSIAKGFYGAALHVQSISVRQDEMVDTLSINILVRFVVPILVHVQGPSAHTKVELTDVGMLYVPESEGPTDSRGIYHASTKVNFAVSNTGETMARVGGRVSVFRQAGDRWRRITEAKMQEKRIIPGVSFTVAEDISRRLPAGKYRLDATASVDGRPLRTLSREIDYEGDPEATTIAADVPLVIDPTDLEIQGVPGATRTILMTVENPSEEKLRVTCSATQHKGLRGVSLGETLGDDYSCNEWVSVKPDIFFLRGGSQRKVRIQLAYPRDITDQPFYYSSLNILVEYTDGQSAGNAEALIIGGNQKGESAPAMQGMGMSLSKLEEDKYAISAVFGNVGNVHLNPKCNGRVTDATGMKLIKNFSLVKQSGLVLPLGTSRFGGTIDFAGVRPGIYIINVKVEFAEQNQTQTMNVRVTRGQEYNLVEIIEK